MKNIALIISLVGILVLLLFINIAEPKEIQISEINEKYLDRKVKVIGEVREIKVFENNFTSFKISDIKNKTNEINIICNCPNITSKSKLKIIGRITKYKGELQIQADIIKEIQIK